MTWPAPDSSANIAVTNADAGTDSPASARPDILALINEVNSLKALVNSIINNGQPLTLGGSEAATAFVNAALGLKVGNANIADANTLDWYQEGTWTPAFQIGGTAAGVTGRGGWYVRIGKTVVFNGGFAGSKGSLTGSLSVDGLPFTSTAGLACLCQVRMVGTSLNAPFGVIQSGSASITLQNSTSTGPVTLTDANVGSILSIDVAGVYQLP